MCKSNQISEFNLEGRFLGFVLEDGYKLKYLRLANAEGEYWIKLAKPLRETLDRSLSPGTWVRVAGERKLKSKTGELKLKAYLVEPSALRNAGASPPIAEKIEAPDAKPKATILVCQKSDCCKRGGIEVCQALQKTLRDRGLEDIVTIKGTGCLKQCKAGPNIVMMPDKTRYSQVHPDEIPAILDKHLEQLTPQLACQQC